MTETKKTIKNIGTFYKLLSVFLLLTGIIVPLIYSSSDKSQEVMGYSKFIQQYPFEVLIIQTTFSLLLLFTTIQFLRYKLWARTIFLVLTLIIIIGINVFGFGKLLIDKNVTVPSVSFMLFNNIIFSIPFILIFRRVLSDSIKDLFIEN